MVEPKQNNIAAVGLESNNNDVEDSSNLPGDDSWIIVKKQKVNILIPCLPSIEQPMPTVPDLEHDLLHENMTTIPSEIPLEEPPKACLADRNDGSMSCSPKSNTQSSTKVYLPADNTVAIPKPRKPDFRRLTSENQVGGLRSFSGKTETRTKFHKTSPKLIRPFVLPSVVCNLSTSTINFNKKTRASNVERNIVGAGGLGRWLSSLGLEQFEGILRAKNVNKFQLADLSMKKLKDMGAHAVGPRRKLIHAIECVCQPYSHERYRNLHNQLR